MLIQCVAQLAFFIIDVTLRGADVFVAGKCLYQVHVNSFVSQICQKLSSAAVATCTFDGSHNADKLTLSISVPPKYVVSQRVKADIWSL